MRLVACLVLLPAWLVACCLATFVEAPFRRGDLSGGHRFARRFSRGCLWGMGLHLDVQGLEHLESAQPCVYVANHQSNLDVLFHGRVYPPRTLVVGKREIAWIPFFGLMFWITGNLLLDRRRRDSALAQMDKGLEAMRERGASIWVFPEGTRGRSEEMLPFKKGAFRLAMAAGRPLVPVVLGRVADRVDVRRLHLSPGRLGLRILEPVDPAPYLPDRLDDLVAEVRRRMDQARRELAAES